MASFIIQLLIQHIIYQNWFSVTIVLLAIGIYHNTILLTDSLFSSSHHFALQSHEFVHNDALHLISSGLMHLAFLFEFHQF